MDINTFRERYPEKTAALSSGNFKYRYFQNPDKKETVALFTGGIGFSDLFYRHFYDFAKEFSVITFDYHEEYKGAEEFCSALSELFKKLRIKPYLVGQSLGGFVAQVMAKEHPEDVKGLILSNTGTLSADMGPDAEKFLNKMLTSQKFAKLLLKVMPFSLYKKLTAKLITKMIPSDKFAGDSGTASEMQEITLQLMNRSYEEHMINFLCALNDCQKSRPSDFEYLRGRVLLILSEDDDTFNDGVKDALINVMPDPDIVRDIAGGHLALILNPEAYERRVCDFINSRI